MMHLLLETHQQRAKTCQFHLQNRAGAREVRASCALYMLLACLGSLLVCFKEQIQPQGQHFSSNQGLISILILATPLLSCRLGSEHLISATLLARGILSVPDKVCRVPNEGMGAFFY